MQQVPPAGDIERPPIQLNETYFAVKNKAIASWVSVKVIEFTDSTTMGGNVVKSYKIRYLNTPYQMIKTVTAKHLAYFEPPPVRLTIGKQVHFIIPYAFISISDFIPLNFRHSRHCLFQWQHLIAWQRERRCSKRLLSGHYCRTIEAGESV